MVWAHDFEENPGEGGGGGGATTKRILEPLDSVSEPEGEEEDSRG